jgi:mutator protein MutT
MNDITPVSIIIPWKIENNRPVFWMQQRQTEGELHQHWEFPGGKWEHGEVPEDAARREFKEEVGEEVNGPLQLLNIYHHKYENARVGIFAYLWEVDRLPSSDSKGFKEWGDSTLKVPAVNHQIVEEALHYLEGVRVKESPCSPSFN